MQVRTIPVPPRCCCCCRCSGSGPGSRYIRNSDRAAQAGRRAGSGRARGTAATVSSGSASPGAQCHGGAPEPGSGRPLRPPRLGRAAANGLLWLPRPEAASRSGREGRGRRCYAPGPAPKARPPRRLALQSQGPLATSFFHSQKKSNFSTRSNWKCYSHSQGHSKKQNSGLTPFLKVRKSFLLPKESFPGINFHCQIL